jgi:hypothetical protein
MHVDILHNRNETNPSRSRASAQCDHDRAAPPAGRGSGLNGESGLSRRPPRRSSGEQVFEISFDQAAIDEAFAELENE